MTTETRRLSERQIFAITFGQMLRGLRETGKLTQADLAKRARLSQSALSRFEKGQSIPDVWQLGGLGAALLFGDYIGDRVGPMTSSALVDTAERLMFVAAGSADPATDTRLRSKFERDLVADIRHALLRATRISP